MHPKSLVILIGLAGIATAFAFYAANFRPSTGAAAVAPSDGLEASSTDRRSDQPVDAPERLAIDEPIVAPVVTEALPPAAPDQALAPALIGDEIDWAREYADKPLEVLRADEARLRKEQKTELDAEVDKRMKDGRYLEYPQGSQPQSASTRGILVGRGDARSIKYVNIDAVDEPQYWAKERKADWLAAEIARRQ